MPLAVRDEPLDGAMTRTSPAVRAVAAAFERAYDESWLPVFRFALAWTNDWQAAEDTAQEAFVRLWANRERVDWSDRPLPWLLTTTKRLATDRFRRLRRLLANQPRVREEMAGPDGETRWLDVRAAWARLSSAERAALALTAVVGFTSEEAAGVLGTTPASVRSAVYRARAKLEEAR